MMESKGIVGYEFEEYFKNIPLIEKFYQGVFSIDQIPPKIAVKHFVVLNLSTSNELGTHWILLF